jgi:lipopolysaccharide transport system ATP-binding protein
MTIAIKIENLSKQYELRHQKRERYVSLRDVITNKATAVFKGLRDIGHAKNSSEDQTRETFWALKDINLEIQQGDRIGIIGRNGAGKSTLLKLLSRIVEPTSGKISIKGRISSLLEVGTGFHPELTGRENIFLNGAILGMRHHEIKRKFDEIVDFAEVEKFLDTPVKHYSSGMYMRLAFSVAAHLDPEILVIDEVLAVGDAQFQKKCLGKMQEVGEDGRTVIFVSHNIDAIASLCNKGILLHHGEVKCIDTAEIVTQMYMSSMHESEYSIKTCARAKQGGIEIQDVWIEDENNKPINTVDMGHGTNICVKFSVNDDLKGKKTDVGFGVDTMDGRRLFTTLASWKRAEIVPKSNEVIVRCNLQFVPLNPNKYLISAAVINESDAWDYAFHCATFDVVNESKDFYFKVAKDQGDFSVPFNFESYEFNKGD